LSKTFVFTEAIVISKLKQQLGLGDIKKIISRLLSRKLSRYSIISR
jgi:hypothetical protein